ncbi:diguanylate cyclase (GGDEF)-like protein [Actimicrobium sp. GrIS 1.19]|uniref:bifunctional diguanylate cyclase/phosphodiesterase n=1 Tax=Actimicrobium sp. GrIS 1.19 TaxID=3071708 RepID=UPI002E015255|nr:diguanylate cyclase (GGDEF)-like protein [Actimicrobium sp. GrIS 1.19]
MPSFNRAQFQAPGQVHTGFVRDKLYLILLWPLLAVLLGTAMWGLIDARMANEKSSSESLALRDTEALAQAYAEDLARLVEQIDQITRHVKHDWESSQRHLDLAAPDRRGLYPATEQMFVSIVSASGITLTSTRALPAGSPPAASDPALLRAASTSSTLQISTGFPATHAAAPAIPPAIHFTRRLGLPDGGFDGMVEVIVMPATLLKFYADARLGQHGFLLLGGRSGKVHAVRMGNRVVSTSAALLNRPYGFDSNAGAALLEADQFADKMPRIVGWEAVRNTPWIAAVGRSEDDAFAGWRANRQSYRDLLCAGAAMLTLLAAAATAASVWLAWRRNHTDRIEATYRLAIDAGDEGFYMINALYDRHGHVADFQVEDCNARGAAFVGSARRDLIGKKISELDLLNQPRQLVDLFDKAMDRGVHQDEFCAGATGQGEMQWLRRRLIRLGDGLAMTLRDISETRAHATALSMIANSDALTQLPNRHWLIEFLPGAIAHAAAHGRRLAVLFVDMDDFKNINDLLGHGTGDELLRSVAGRLRNLLGKHDSIARLGGDEFTIVLEHVQQDDSVEQAAQRIAAAFDEPFEVAGDSTLVRASIGISLYPENGNDAQTLLKHADIAMYSAKVGGKARYCFYQPHLSASLSARLTARKELELAIEQDQFTLFFQPRVDANTGAFCSMEALVRWLHPTRGVVPPTEFIPLAEETGLILKLGAMVIDKTCAQIDQWQRQQLPLLPVSINVSPRQFSQGNLCQQLADAMQRHDIAAHLIEVELTESCMMSDHADMVSALAELKALGIRLLVDDFGTGYSSLSQLQRLDLDVLKVDRAFTSELDRTEEGVVFFRAIISMAHALGMTVVAEGVESDAQLRLLQELGCNEIQGFLIARPMPASEIPARLRQPHWAT